MKKKKHLVSQKKSTGPTWGGGEDGNCMTEENEYEEDGEKKPHSLTFCCPLETCCLETIW